MEILNGKSKSEKILAQIAANVTKKERKLGRKLRMDILIAGEDFASLKYVEMKRNKAKEIGIRCVVHNFDANVEEKELIVRLLELNDYDQVDGIMVQLPLPDRKMEGGVLEVIDPEKDIDGLTSENLGLLLQGSDLAIPPATPKGVMMLLDEYNIDLKGKYAVVVGRSDIVGKPMAAMLLNADATVTITHSRTKDLTKYTREADILVASAGIPKMIKDDMVKDGVVVIDVGIHKDHESGIIVGDVDFEKVKNKASFITPVPGGVGPMTITALLHTLSQQHIV